jgi:hypothetical protein
MRRRLSSFPLILAATLALAGCGLEANGGSGGAKLTITHAFGSQAVGTHLQHSLAGGETVKQLLEHAYTVRTGPDGRVVESIGGAAANGRGLQWSFWVNGIAPVRSARIAPVDHGDQVWWDLHDSVATRSIPAVVGSYPEPFTTGIGGRRLPTVLACATDVQRACTVVAHALERAGVKVADQLLGGGSGSDSLAVIVGTFRDLHGVIAAQLIKGGPSQSGVYAQFVGDGGAALELDDPQGQVVRTAGRGAGLVAATEQPGLNEPAWLVTGTDAAGVAAAAGALTPEKLHNHLALAVVGGRDVALPLDPAR